PRLRDADHPRRGGLSCVAERDAHEDVRGVAGILPPVVVGPVRRHEHGVYIVTNRRQRFDGAFSSALSLSWLKSPRTRSATAPHASQAERGAAVGPGRDFVSGLTYTLSRSSLPTLKNGSCLRERSPPLLSADWVPGTTCTGGR